MKHSRAAFILMFSIFFLLNMNYAILRSLRTTLAVVDLGSGAHNIPFYELFGAMPGAVLITWMIAIGLRRLSLEKVFVIAMTLFLGFFLLFEGVIYPSIVKLKEIESYYWICSFCSMLFYTISELWKPALTVVLFWGLINQFVPMQNAKRLYGPLMLGGSFGSVVAGPVISYCSSFKAYWVESFHGMTLIILISGIVTLYLYCHLWKLFSKEYPEHIFVKQESISLSNSLSLCRSNSQLRLLCWIVIADYIAYSLGEVLFLDILKQKYSDPQSYCAFMGTLSTWSGILTLLSSVFLAPYMLTKYRWAVAALVTPICLLITEGGFFIFLRGHSFLNVFGWMETDWVHVVIILGSIQYCLCRAAKYTLFDSSKELAFVYMPDLLKMQGKIVVDGICARIGRGAASFLSISFIQVFGGVLASSLITGCVAMAVILSWIKSTWILGQSIEKKQPNVMQKAL